MDLLIASRQSDLARVQAHEVGESLKALGHQVSYHFRPSLGDLNDHDPLWQMPEKGVFTQDFRQGLKQGDWDLVVHSWKDLPIEPCPHTELGATLPRADPRDLFLFKKEGLSDLKSGGELGVFSSSPRRMYNLEPFLKKALPLPLKGVSFQNIRGNILTRIQKLMDHEGVHGLVVAKAALDRLLGGQGESFQKGQDQLKVHLAQCLIQVLPLSQNPTAAAQGALAVEIKKGREDLKEVLGQIHCDQTWYQVQEEREILKSYGGGCDQKIGVTQVKGPFGTCRFLRGETSSGEALRQISLSQKISPLKKPFTGKLSLFHRELVDFTPPLGVEAHWVSHPRALPESYDLPPEHILWTSGVKTWFQLAARGYWVHGCSDSLGESFQGPGSFFGKRSWAKWTHEGGPVAPDQEAVRTYRLVPKSFKGPSFEPISLIQTPEQSPSQSPEGERLPDLSLFKEFYWMSGSQFERALELFPSIGGCRHFCGPGHTYTNIQKWLKNHGAKGEVTPLPSQQVWLELVRNTG